MNTDKAILIHKDLTDLVLGAFFDVYNALGHGFVENVYENAMAIAQAEAGLHTERQLPIAIYYRGQCIGEYRADLVVERQLIVEVKAQSMLVPAHVAQLLNYLKATKVAVGMLLNFGPKAQFKRLVFTQSPIRVDPCQSAAKHHV